MGILQIFTKLSIVQQVLAFSAFWDQLNLGGRDKR